MEILKYKTQAKRWQEALPLGNGHTGVMVFGGRKHETLCFNDVTLWSGYPKNQTNSKSLENLDAVRSLIFSGKNDEAQRVTEKMLNGGYSEAYMPLGDALINFDSCKRGGYERRLDLSTAVHTVKLTDSERTAFASHADDCVVYRFESGSAQNITLTLKSLLHACVCESGGALCLCGNAPDYAAPSYLGKIKNAIRYDEHKGMSFCLACKAYTDGDVKICGGKMKITGAKSTVFVFTTRTGYKAYNEMPETNVETVCAACCEALEKTENNYNFLLERHMADYGALYNAGRFSLGAFSDKYTDELVFDAQHGNADKTLVELFYNFGKYLTIAGSRRGGQPLNLQGIWNRKVRPPWSSNYTVNINTQMNYWGASGANLGECVEPLINMAYELMQAGKETARVNYGCEGGCCNHNTDLWRKTTPVSGDACYMFSPLCGAWIVNEAYAHYKNSGVEEYREKAEAAVRESAAFVNCWLVEHDGYYVTAPSTSPEASFKFNGKNVAVDYATAFDMCVARQAIANLLETEPNSELAAQLREKQKRLYPINGGKTGIIEWSHDYKIFEQGHRHFSPLYGFYPARVIKYYENPEQRELIRRLFFERTENWPHYIGWSAAWAICLAGRLHEGECAVKIIENMLGHSVFTNLFDIHPPFLFQIDGNLGFVAGVHEMLCYEENGVIELLPALPEKWQEGKIENLVVNGNRLSFEWKNGKVTKIDAEKPVTLRADKTADGCVTGKNVSII